MKDRAAHVPPPAEAARGLLRSAKSLVAKAREQGVGEIAREGLATARQGMKLAATAPGKIQASIEASRDYFLQLPSNQDKAEYVVAVLLYLLSFMGGFAVGFQVPQVDLKMARKGAPGDRIVLHAFPLMVVELATEWLSTVLEYVKDGRNLSPTDHRRAESLGSDSAQLALGRTDGRRDSRLAETKHRAHAASERQRRRGRFAQASFQSGRNALSPSDSRTQIMKTQWLIYGANGYTGGLIAREAIARGVRPVLAGRNRELRARCRGAVWAASPGFRFEARRGSARRHRRGFALRGPVLGYRAADGGGVSRHPNALPRHHGRDRRARMDLSARGSSQESGRHSISGAGFDVVPSDCLALHLANRLPGATELELAFTGSSAVSPGTMKTMVENIHTGGKIRRDGKIVSVPDRLPLEDRSRRNATT